MRLLPEGADTDRLEFEAGWLAFGFVSGIGYLVTPADVVVRALLPHWFTYAWAAAFLLGGLVGFTALPATFSIVGRRRYWGLAGERAAMGLQAAAVSTLGVALVYLWMNAPAPLGVRGAFPLLSLTLAAVWLAVALRRIVRTTQIIRSMTEGSEGEGVDEQR